MSNIASFVIVIFFFWGRSLRLTNIKKHILVMKGVIVADLALVIFLVIHREALSKVGMTMPWTLKIHVPIAVCTVLLYIPTAWTGYQLTQGKPVHARMRLYDRILVPARVLTLITSLMVQFIAVN